MRGRGRSRATTTTTMTMAVIVRVGNKSVEPRRRTQFACTTTTFKDSVAG